MGSLIFEIGQIAFHHYEKGNLHIYTARTDAVVDHGTGSCPAEGHL